MFTQQDYSARWIACAALLGLFAVALGAIASHALAEAKAISAIEKAALYQLIHTLALLFAVQLKGRTAQLSRWLFFIGIVLFCGSIELKYLFDFPGATVVAPTGGVSLMLGWVFLGIAGVRQIRTSETHK
jgi:uncharacterized membrane protein YgdD (TMEM256/DUF423 family)